jgi:hypothetical protein
MTKKIRADQWNGINKPEPNPEEYEWQANGVATVAVSARVSSITDGGIRGCIELARKLLWMGVTLGPWD